MNVNKSTQVKVVFYGNKGQYIIAVKSKIKEYKTISSKSAMFCAHLINNFTYEFIRFRYFARHL